MFNMAKLESGLFFSLLLAFLSWPADGAAAARENESLYFDVLADTTTTQRTTYDHYNPHGPLRLDPSNNSEHMPA